MKVKIVMKNLYFKDQSSKKFNQRISSYQGRETLERQVGTYSHFSSNSYLVHKMFPIGGKFIGYRITFFDVVDLHHAGVQIAHCIVDLKCRKLDQDKIEQALRQSQTIVFKAKVTKYKKQNITRSRQEFDLFRRLADFENGRKLHEVKPRTTYSLVGAVLDSDELHKNNN